MNLSIIIPTYNEESKVRGLLLHLQKNCDTKKTEIIVVDGGSSDRTLEVAKKSGAICLRSSQKGRAAQMNLGAKHGGGQILYFVHADSIPPYSFIKDIKKAVKFGHKAGCYRFQFNSNRLLLKINSYCTRFNRLMCRGGDQTLFIKRPLFEQLGGFKDDYLIMEDYEFIERIQRSSSFKIIPKNVIVSSRKYDENGYFRVQMANFIVFMMYFFGSSQERLLDTYKKCLYQSKL